MKEKIAQLPKTTVKELAQHLTNILLDQPGLNGVKLCAAINSIAKSEGHEADFINTVSLSNIRNAKNKTGEEKNRLFIYYAILYAQNKGIYFNQPAERLVKLFFQKASSINLANSQNWSSIDQLVDVPFWFYYYEYKNSSDKQTVLMKQVFSIHKSKEGVYEALLINRSPYPTYTGTVEFVTETMIACFLKGGGKNQVIYCSIPEEFSDKQADFHTGIYLKHNRDGKIFSGKIVLQAIKDTKPPHYPLDINYAVEDEIKEVHPLIRDFFRQKDTNFLNPPRRFKEDSLKRFMKKELLKKEFDLFVAYPYMTLHRKINKDESIKELIFKELRKFELEDGKKLKTNSKYEELENKLEAILEEKFFKKFESASILQSKANKFKAKVKELIKNLETIDGLEENTKLSIFDSRKDISPSKPDQTPERTIKRDWENLKRSKALLLICPYPDMFSSCWVELGWAMAWNIPIFIVSIDRRKDLPFILHSKSNLFNIYYYYNLSSIDDIPNVYKWIRDEYREQLF